MATIVKNCCTPLFLDFFKHQATKSNKWNFNYPMGKSFEDKHAKIDVIQGDTMHDKFLGGVSMSLLMMIHEKAKQILKDLKIRNAELFHDDGSKLENKAKKYDAILLAAAPLAVPEYLYKSLEIGGRLISPIGNGSTQKLTLVTRVAVEEFKTEELEEVLFVPLLGGLID